MQKVARAALRKTVVSRSRTSFTEYRIWYETGTERKFVSQSLGKLRVLLRLRLPYYLTTLSPPSKTSPTNRLKPRHSHPAFSHHINQNPNSIALNHWCHPCVKLESAFRTFVSCLSLNSHPGLYPAYPGLYIQGGP